MWNAILTCQGGICLCSCMPCQKSPGIVAFILNGVACLEVPVDIINFQEVCSAEIIRGLNDEVPDMFMFYRSSIILFYGAVIGLLFFGFLVQWSVFYSSVFWWSDRSLWATDSLTVPVTALRRTSEQKFIRLTEMEKVRACMISNCRFPAWPFLSFNKAKNNTLWISTNQFWNSGESPTSVRESNGSN